MTDPLIHPTAVIHPFAQLAPNVRVGPYAVIGSQVTLHEGVHVGSHAVLEGPTTIGQDTIIHSFASVGSAPQTRPPVPNEGRLVIGQRNTIREFVTINRGTPKGGNLTKIGDDNLLMAYVHIAHDCVLHSHTILANNTALAGHVHIHDGAVLSGLSAVSQFVHIGSFAFIAGASRVDRDVPPFLRVAGDRARLQGLNLVGLKRAGFTTAQLSALKNAYRALFRTSHTTVQQAIQALQERRELDPNVQTLLAFISNSQLGICR